MFSEEAPCSATDTLELAISDRAVRCQPRARATLQALVAAPALAKQSATSGNAAASRPQDSCQAVTESETKSVTARLLAIVMRRLTFPDARRRVAARRAGRLLDVVRPTPAPPAQRVRLVAPLTCA